MKYFVLISDSTILPKPAENTEPFEEAIPEQDTAQNEVLQEANETTEPEEIEVLTDEDGTYPESREEEPEEEPLQEDVLPKSLDFLYINSTSGNVILHETAETDFLLMGYNPAVLAMTELDKSGSDTTAEESAYAEESELQSESCETDTTEENGEEAPTETTTVEAEIDEDPFRFKEKYNLNACYLSDVKSLSDNARRLGIDAVVLDKIDANDSDRKKNLASVSQAIFGAGYDLVYFHLTKPIAENDEEAAYYLNRELLAIRDHVASQGDTCRFLLITQSEEASVRPFLLTFASETDFHFATTLQDQAIQNPNLLLSALLETQSFDALEELVTEEEVLQAEDNEVKKPISHSIFEWVELFALSLAAVLIIMTFFVRHSPVNGDSMMPTLHNNDVLIITRAGYEPENGDIVIIQTPEYDLRRPLVKRVIAIGNQTVRIDFDTWEIYVDGKLVKEDYINKLNEPMKRYEISNYFNKVDPEQKIYEGVVPEGFVFVLGDNRNNSQDSRALGFIDERFIVGEVNFRLLPISSIGDVE